MKILLMTMELTLNNKELIINNIMQITKELSEFNFKVSKHPMNENVEGTNTFFDSAGIGLKCKEVEIIGTNESKNNKGDWKSIVNDAKDIFAKFINSDNCKISLFHNTTSAVQRVLTQLNNYSAFQGFTLLTTDIEYPGIYAAANEIWEGPICIVKLSDLIYKYKNLKENESEINKRIKKAIRIVKPAVLYFSHVTRSQGYTFDVKNISEYAEKVLPYKFFIVDGAQAVGNICIDINNFPYVDAYVTSGHKWLGGEQHLGILYSDRKWLLEDPAQSYSETIKSAGTGNKNVLLKFIKALEDFFNNNDDTNESPLLKDFAKHNKELAELFIKQLDNKYWQVVGGKDYKDRNGIVVFRPKIKTLNISEVKINEKQVSFTELHPEEVTFYPWSNFRLRYVLIPNGNCEKVKKIDTCGSVEKVEDKLVNNNCKYDKIKNGLYIQHTGQWFRVCFHYFHSEEEVKIFAQVLNNYLVK